MKRMEMSFEPTYQRIFRAWEKKQAEQARAVALREQADSYRKSWPDPKRVEVPDEFLEPQPHRSRPGLGVFQKVKPIRTHRIA